MSRLLAFLVVVLIAIPIRSAPASKEPDKPLPAITGNMRLQASNNLKQIGLGFHNYHDTTGNLPTNYMTKDGKPGLSWRIALLPYIDEDKLFKEFKLDEPWDSDHNSKLVEKIPKAFAAVRGKAEKGQTFVQMFSGEGTMFDSKGKAISFADITDGLSNTIMAVEAAKAVTWTKPTDIEFDGKNVPDLGGAFDGEIHVLMGDGSVKRLPKGMDANTMLAAISRAGGEVLDLDEAIKAARSKE